MLISLENDFMQGLKKRNPGEYEFHQAVQEHKEKNDFKSIKLG